MKSYLREPIDTIGTAMTIDEYLDRSIKLIRKKQTNWRPGLSIDRITDRVNKYMNLVEQIHRDIKEINEVLSKIYFDSDKLRHEVMVYSMLDGGFMELCYYVKFDNNGDTIVFVPSCIEVNEEDVIEWISVNGRILNRSKEAMQ